MNESISRKKVWQPVILIYLICLAFRCIEYFCIRTDESFFGKLMSDCGSGTVKYISIKGLANQVVPNPGSNAIDEFDSDFANASTIREISDMIWQEHQARRKQFEYYRDKLLGFPEKAVGE